MQYLLTDEEYKALVPVAAVNIRKEALEAARKIIVEQANINCGVEYCNECPIAKLESSASHMICKKPRDYIK